MEEIVVDFEKACRTCMKDDSLILKSVFEEDVQFSITLADMINQCSSSKVELTDQLPLQICLDCEMSLRNAYSFRVQCDESYRLLEEAHSKAIKNEIMTEEYIVEPVKISSGSLTPRMRYKKKLYGEEITNDEATDVDELIEEDNCDETEYLETELNEEPDDAVQDETNENQEVKPPKLFNRNFINVSTVLNEMKKSGITYEKLSSSDENQNKYQCKICKKCFSRQTHVRRHLLTHSSIKPYKCNQCDKSFTRSDHLQKHSVLHTGSKPHICGICNKHFSRIDTLRSHIKRHSNDTPLPKKRFSCQICSKTVATRKNLQIHIQTHSEAKTFICKFCSEVFTDKKDLQQHSKLHINERPYLCNECGQRFLRNDYLVVHMRRHQGVKPYKCRYCEKAFPRATDLTVHERYHTEEKTHLCTICGKGFHRAYNLLVHTRVHTGEKPYQCPHCVKSFAQGNDLKAHVRRHTGEKFKCDICNKGFIQGYHLTKHKRDEHGIDEKSHIRRLEKFTTQSAQDIQVLYRTQQEKLSELMQIKSELDRHHVELEATMKDSTVDDQLQETQEKIYEVQRQLEEIEEQRQKILAAQVTTEQYEIANATIASEEIKRSESMLDIKTEDGTLRVVAETVIS